MNNFFAHRPIIALAPMADYTDEPFSLVCKGFGADLIFREMVSSEAIVRGNEKTLAMAKITKPERPVILQIFGANPKVMAEAAAILEEKFKPDGIDINMGCPVRKIVGVGAGCELMRNPKLAAEIVRAVKSSVKVPVSVKMRLGWKKKDEILKFAPMIEKAGADFITIHGRTRDEQYFGEADWEMIGRVKSAVKIPVIANGSVWTADDAARCLQMTKADGIAIARGALGNPWIFEEIKNAVSPPYQGGVRGGKLPVVTPSNSYIPRSLGKQVVGGRDATEITRVIFRHLEFHLKHYGGTPSVPNSYVERGERGIVTFRKHLVFYFRGVPNAKELRARLVAVKSEKELKNILSSLTPEKVV
ncbi:MAG: tRNA-dihydrouridine synthase family protein [Patescibacteria group bacterium]